jgi:hypothetical protein
MKIEADRSTGINPSKATLTEMVGASFAASNRHVARLEAENVRLKYEAAFLM